MRKPIEAYQGTDSIPTYRSTTISPKLCLESDVRELEADCKNLEQQIESMRCCGNCGNGKNNKYGRANSYCDDCENNEDPPRYWSTPPSDNWKPKENI